MKVTSQVKLNREMIDKSYIDYADQKKIIEHDMAIAFAKELLKGKELLEVRHISISDMNYSIFEIQAIVLSMRSFQNLIEYLSLHLSPESMRELKNNLINKL